MADWMYWALGGFMCICTLVMIYIIWNAEEVEDYDDWSDRR